MNSRTINLKQEMSLNEAITFILAVGTENSIHLEGEQGIGKTAMAEMVYEKGKATYGFKHFLFLSGPNIELGEAGIYMPNHESATTTFYPNESWKIHKEEPMLIFIDEETKASKEIQHMLHPLHNERRYGPFKLHKNTIVVTTGNYSSVGVGDVMDSHTRNRKTVVPIAKPTAEDWCIWGSTLEPRPIHELVLAYVADTPQAMASFRTGDQDDNHLIFHPKRSQDGFWSGRSGHKASNIMYQKDKISRKALEIGLVGTVGESAGRGLLAFVDTAEDLPTFKEIIDDPLTAKVPDSPSARCILIFSAIQKVDPSNIGKWFEYLKRAFTKEQQTLFCMTAKDHTTAKTAMFSSKAFVEWARDNQYLF
tara:strand:- start:212 stop:1306 length:1095 start_codon:yes stop_codon:yes gene_type:complete